MEAVELTAGVCISQCILEPHPIPVEAPAVNLLCTIELTAGQALDLFLL